MKTSQFLLTLLGMTALASVGSAGAATTFQGVGELPGGQISSGAVGVSGNGTVVVGASSSINDMNQAFAWTSGGGMVGLVDSTGTLSFESAHGVSDDGNVVVGFGSNNITGQEWSVRWTSGGGMVELGDLPGGFVGSAANAVSADGSVVVGSSFSGLSDPNGSTEAFRWTIGGGMVGLGDLAGGQFDSGAYEVSADGTVVVGVGNSASGYEAFRWTAGGGMVGLGDLAGGQFDSGAYGVSADGASVVGYSTSVNGREAFRWTAGGGMVGLGDFAGGFFNSTAYGISANGAIVVGSGTSAEGLEAFRWDAANGMQNIADLLTAAGINLTGWSLTQANAISDDGLTIVGYGTHNGNPEGWIAKFSQQATFHPADTNGNSGVSLNEATGYAAAFLNGASWPTPPTPPTLNYATRSAYLFLHGQTYTEDSSKTPPLNWVSNNP